MTPRPQIPIRRQRALNAIALISAAVLLLTAAALGYYAYTLRRNAASGGVSLEVDRPERLTNTGNALLAAISPDGRYVAHVKNDPGAPSLWMRQAATTSDVQIVPPAPVRYDGVSFSPDGDHVYYVTYEPAGGIGTLFRVPALGGTPQKVLEDVDSRITFSPDRSQFAFTRGAPAEGTAWVMVANADGTNVRRLAELEKPDQFTLNGPAWSSDGKTIVAPARSLREGPHALIAGIDVASGGTTRLQGRWGNVLDLEWVPGTSSFVAAATEFGPGTPQLWQISYPGGETRRITNDLNTYASLSLSNNGTSLATVQTEAVANLFVASKDNPAVALQITRGRGRGDGLSGVDWTPDGEIVFVSSASGRQQVWITDAEGRNIRQLTAAQQEPVFGASVTPDGRYIVFQRFADRRMRLWRMNVDGSDQQMLTNGDLDQGPVAANGVSYFFRVEQGSPRTFKVPIDGGEPVQVSDQNFRPLDVSPDGSQMLGVGWDTAARRSALAILPVTGGAPRLLPQVPAFFGTFSSTGKEVVYPVVDRGAMRIDQLDIASGKVTTLGAVPDIVFNGAVSPDGKRVALSRGLILSDVLLLTMKRATK